MKKILILTGAKPKDKQRKNLKMSMQLAESMNSTESKFEAELFNRLIIRIINNKIQIETSNGVALNKYDTVFIKFHSSRPIDASCVAEYCKQESIRMVGQEIEDYRAVDKQEQLCRLASHDFPVIDSIFINEDQDISQEELKHLQGDKFVIKASRGRIGDDNYLCNTYEQLMEMRKLIGKRVVIQPYIVNDRDYRVLCFGYKAKLIMERIGDKKSHLNNVSKGASAGLIPVDKFNPEFIKIAEDSARVVKRDVAGVDLLIDDVTKKPYILEINQAPKFVGGAFEREKQAKLAEYLAEGSS